MSSNFLTLIADRALNRPLMITPDKAQVIVSVLAGRIGIGNAEASQFIGSDRAASGRKPYRVTPEGVAVITILGSLVNRGAWIGANSGLTSYEGINFQVSSAADDAAVRAIILDIDSPGGEAVGASEAAAVVRDAAKRKPVTAIVNGMACSAAYLIASGAREIVTTETGISGSIGVFRIHVDHSGELKDAGIAPTLIFAGAHKVDGNPFEPLTDAVRADMQAELNQRYDSFVSAVGKGRGAKLTADAARKTEARTFIGAAAVKAGLADRIGTFENVLAEILRGAAASRQPPKGATSMDEITEARAAGAADERARISAILRSPEAMGREAQATAFALDTDMAVESARKLMATIPKTVPGTMMRAKDAPGGLVTAGPDFPTSELIRRATARNGG